MTARMSGSDSLPRATVSEARSGRWIWLVPLLALLLAGGLVYRAWMERGIPITIVFDHGHGLKPGDALRYRGIVIGQVADVSLTDDSEAVAVRVMLNPDAESLAVRGARFWIVRPVIGPGGVEGLETVVGPRSIAMLPGDEEEPRRYFTGLAQPPVVESFSAGDMEVVLEAPSREGLQAGAPVLYRDIPIGRVLLVGLASDGGAVEIRLHIDAAYANLVREKSRFWMSGGLKIGLGLTQGLNVEMSSLSSIVLGGVTMATPPEPGATVRSGHRFRLDRSEPESAREWRPSIAVGSALLPPNVIPPRPVRTEINWKEGLFRRSKVRRGWALPVEGGVLGLRSLLSAPSDAREGSITLTIDGQTVPGSVQRESHGDRLSMLSLLPPPGLPWPTGMMRHAGSLEDVVLFAGAGTDPLPVSATRLGVIDSALWKIDQVQALSEDWYGAIVLSRENGHLLGFVEFIDNEAHIALLPE